MRIVQISPSYAPCVGGAERLLQAVSENLVARGHQVTVLTFDCATQRDFASPHGAGLPRNELLGGVRIVRVNPGGLRFKALYRWWLRQRGGWRTLSWLLGEDSDFPFVYPNGSNALLPLLRLDADVICSVNWGFGIAYWVYLARKLRRVPLVAVPLLHIEQPWSRREVYSRMLKQCDAVITCTEVERDFVLARGARVVTVAGAGVEPDRYRRRDGGMIRARHGLGDRLVVGFVGRQAETKGAPTVVEAMVRVWRQAPNAVLLMAGPSAHRDAATEQALGALHPAARQNVVLIDDFPDSDGPSIMDACDILVLPSAEEAFGLVMVEAWLCGKPVIAGDIPSTRCIVEHGVDGWLVTPFDADELAARILGLLADLELRAEFGRRGMAKALARYTIAKVTDHWEETYRRAVDGVNKVPSDFQSSEPIGG